MSTRKREKRKEQIKCLQERVSFLENKNGEIEQQIDWQEQYSITNCLLIHAIEERRHKVTDEVVIETTKSDGYSYRCKGYWPHSSDRCKNRKQTSTLIVKFVRYLERREAFNSKKRLKGKNLSITKSLTKLLMSKLRAARDEYGFRNVCTLEEKILYQMDDTPNCKPAIYYQ